MERLAAITHPPRWRAARRLLHDLSRAPSVGGCRAIAEADRAEMVEHGDTFATFVRRYRLDRSEGLVLRYLSDAWRALAGMLRPVPTPRHSTTSSTGWVR